MSVLKTDCVDNIYHITLSRPEKLNALNTEIFQALSQEWLYVQKTPHIKGVLITGEGKAFCAGADLNQLAKADSEGGLVFAHEGQSVFRHLEMLGKPSIAAINGMALGGGCELAMAASMRIASSQARFGQPEIKLGLIPGYGATVRLPRLIGKGRALDLCLSGRLIDAQTALDWGLITQMCLPEDLIKTAHETLLQLSTLPPLALKATLEIFDITPEVSPEQAMLFEAKQFALLCATEDKKEGVHAFLEKRVAKFTGI